MLFRQRLLSTADGQFNLETGSVRVAVGRANLSSRGLDNRSCDGEAEAAMLGLPTLACAPSLRACCVAGFEDSFQRVGWNSKAVVFEVQQEPLFLRRTRWALAKNELNSSAVRHCINRILYEVDEYARQVFTIEAHRKRTACAVYSEGDAGPAR